MAVWPPPKPSLDLNIKKEIDEAIENAFSESTIIMKVSPFPWWNVRIRFAMFLIRMASWVLGCKIDTEPESPRSKYGDIG